MEKDPKINKRTPMFTPESRVDRLFSSTTNSQIANEKSFYKVN